MNTKKMAYDNVKSNIKVKKIEYKQKFLYADSYINNGIFAKTYDIYDSLLNLVHKMELEDED